MLALRRVLNDPGRCQDVVGHRLVFCETAQRMPTEDLLLDCWCCNCFFAYCCACTERQRPAEAARRFYDSKPPKPCHYYKVAFVDGACWGNGQDEATAGIGIAIGVNPMTMQWAIPIDDEVDPCATRTSQRAELLAAIYGIRKLAESEDCSNKDGEAREEHSDKITWVITSDSEYVVKGMTEWVPAWKVSHSFYILCLCLICLNRAMDGATHRKGDPRILISSEDLTWPSSTMNTNITFTSLSGISVAFTMNLLMNWLGLPRGAKRLNYSRLNKCRYTFLQRLASVLHTNWIASTSPRIILSRV